MARANGKNAYGGNGNANTAIMRPLRHVMMDAVFEGDVAPDFEGSLSKPLIPIIFCHGISSNRTMQSGSCRDFASHGYIVFMLDHKDGTASFYKSLSNEDTGSFYDNSKLLNDYSHRRDQIQTRVQEIIKLIDELHENNGKALLQKLGFPSTVKIDLSKLIVGGHSFGGMTAVYTAREDERVKLVGTLDPWLFAHHEEILAGDF